jgi:DtxR family Mn-dependent transcriptional regulator
MNSLIEENYLKAFYYLSQDKEEVGIGELSEALDIKMPTVTSMMKKLAKKGLDYYESYKPPRLTKEGKLQSALIVRKHRLTEMFLVDNMGFGWEEVHDIAEQIEHIKSPAFFNKMDELLGYPTTDPHGSPIPAKDGSIPNLNAFKLNDCDKGDRVIVVAVVNSTNEFLDFLNKRKIALGVQLTVISKEPFDNSIIVEYAGKQGEMLSQPVCERLLVERV